MNYRQVILIAVAFFLATQLTLSMAYAQAASQSSSETVSPTTVDYQLPYPGMLPDNPLYFLKAFRDNLTALFLSKPLDKAQFDLMQSDKNVESSYLLVTQVAGKTDLAVKTFTRGQEEFSEAIAQVISAKKQGYSITDLSKKLELSNQKHIQILNLLEQHEGQNNSQWSQNQHNQANLFTKEIKAMRP